MDYRKYHMGRSELVRYVLEAALITGVSAFCFYNSAWACLLYPLVLVWYLREKKRELQEKQRKAVKMQFKDMVQALAAALAAGYSAENALSEARRDMQLTKGESREMLQEISSMLRKLDANQSMEEVMRDFAQRSGLEEAEVFAEVFQVGKRNGGDLIEIMKDTARTISETVETERQVAEVLASRRYEQKIMNMMPFAILFYLRAGCPGFLDPLYGNLPGICAATACLGLYLVSWHLGRKLLEIEV